MKLLYSLFCSQTQKILDLIILQPTKEIFSCREVHSSPFSRKNERQINKRDRQKKHLFVFC